MIIGLIAPAVQRFYRQCLASADGLGVWAGIALPILVHGLLLATRRRRLEALGAATLTHWLCAGSVCRWLARLRFPVDRWHEHACRRLLAAAARRDPDGEWFLLFDGSDTKRGGLAKIQKTRRYGKKPKGWGPHEERWRLLVTNPGTTPASGVGASAVCCPCFFPPRARQTRICDLPFR